MGRPGVPSTLQDPALLIPTAGAAWEGCAGPRARLGHRHHPECCPTAPPQSPQHCPGQVTPPGYWGHPQPHASHCVFWPADLVHLPCPKVTSARERGCSHPAPHPALWGGPVGSSVGGHTAPAHAAWGPPGSVAAPRGVPKHCADLGTQSARSEVLPSPRPRPPRCPLVQRDRGWWHLCGPGHAVPAAALGRALAPRAVPCVSPARPSRRSSLSPAPAMRPPRGPARVPRVSHE